MVTILPGDCIESLEAMKARGERVNMCVTSPPYFGLRDYGVDGQIGLEPSPDDYVARLVEVFRRVRDVLTDDGSLWLNLGDSYAADRGGTGMPAETLAGGKNGHGDADALRGRGNREQKNARRNCTAYGLKHKDLIGIPWRVAFALQADGWWLRQDIIWAKPNPMPESVKDRCTRSHEYLFHLTKRDRYYYDAAAIREPISEGMQRRAAAGHTRGQGKLDASRQDAATIRPTRIVDEGRNKRDVWEGEDDKQRGHERPHQGFNERWDSMTKEQQQAGGANKRDVWRIATRPYRGAHFATFPPKLIEPCILATSRPNDLVLDPFGGSGTTGAVARQHGRHAILLELNSDYVALAKQRCGLNGVHDLI